ncbi:MAG: hypothetical protein ACR2H2_10805 [Solirubrobacteraceae bacterium]
MTVATSAIAIRHATDADICVLADLAILDSRRQLTGPALIAEVDGIARAALDLRDGSVAADPFFPTAELVDLLRVRARRLEDEAPARSLRERAIARVRRPRRALSMRA